MAIARQVGMQVPQSSEQNYLQQQRATQAAHEQSRYNQIALDTAERNNAAQRDSQYQAALRLNYAMASPDNYNWETDGQNINVNNAGSASRSASGSSGGGGLSIGGGTYPDVSGLLAQFRNTQPQVTMRDTPPPVVPGSPSTFAHAKDVAGRQGNKAIEALNNMMTRRGISDSGMAAQGAAEILGGVGRQAAQAEFDRANLDNARQWEANKLGYQGNINQNTTAYQGGITQRGQDIDSFLALLRQLY